jgi:penicillin-insensitive murein endopeptidase
MGILLGIMFLGWGDVLKPSSGLPEPIGFYSSGCIQGAHSLPLQGAGFQVMRPSRNRYYGHPQTLQFIQDLGGSLAPLQSGILIGDLSQPRGGPMPSGHASHQVGLDVDVWFWSHPEQSQRPLSLDEREKLPMVSMLGSNGLVDPAKFTSEQLLKLKLAASSPNVERIFVNPAIKTYLCATIPASESAWLRTLRPWAGHDAHFHVRLTCPKDAKDCVPQTPPTPGNGCNEVIPAQSPQLAGIFEEDEEFEQFAPFPQRCQSILTKQAAETGTKIENKNF